MLIGAEQPKTGTITKGEKREGHEQQQSAGSQWDLQMRARSIKRTGPLPTPARRLSLALLGTLAAVAASRPSG